MAKIRMADLPETLAADAEKAWADFAKSAKTSGIAVPGDSALANSLKRMFAFSEFAVKTCVRCPEILDGLVRSGDLENTYPPNTYGESVNECLSDLDAGSDTFESDIKHALRLLRQREMFRIAFRDLSGLADLSETVSDLSALADACVRQTARLVYERLAAQFGTPEGPDGRSQSLVVMAMGKLGANELNFSSDIDLIFAFPEAGRTTDDNRTIGNEEFFARQCRSLMSILSENTADGFVFRVDADLRPYGKSGPLAMSFDAVETYYRKLGREWERYAWIKARPVAGNPDDCQTLLKRLHPFIYRRYLDYGMVDSVRGMRRKITLELRRKKIKGNLKLGPGGIREVEFYVQAFQLVRGGVTPGLRETGVLKLLDALASGNRINAVVRDELATAYVFLRNTEHRLQEYADRQTQILPSDANGKLRLAVSMGFPDWDTYAEQLDTHMKNVRRHSAGLLEHAESQSLRTETGLDLLWQDRLGEEQALGTLREIGFENGAEVVSLLNWLRDNTSTRKLSQEGIKRLDRLVPLVLERAGASEGPDLALRQMIDLIASIGGRTNYLSLLLENPDVLSRLADFSAKSSWITAYLSRHPVLLDELFDLHALYRPFDRNALELEITRKINDIPPDEFEYQMDELRIFKQTHTLRVAAADISDKVPLMRVSDYLTDIAETVVNTAIRLAWDYLTDKHGIPGTMMDGEHCETGFAVIAYGKMGGIELGYDSDLDMVFLHAGTDGQTRGEKPVDNFLFFTRLGQRVVHILTAHTPAGVLYEADMRLRPSGGSGILVCHTDAYAQYQTDSAWTWEKQALVRARAVAGDRRIVDRFDAIRKAVLAIPRKKPELQKEIAEMRQRMAKENSHEPGIFHLKQGPGGMIDVEFIVQYLVLANAFAHPEILRWTDNVRLIRSLMDTDIITDVEAYFLRKAYLTYRSSAHRLALREKSAKVPDDMFAHLRTAVKHIWESHIGNHWEGG